MEHSWFFERSTTLISYPKPLMNKHHGIISNFIAQDIVRLAENLHNGALDMFMQAFRLIFN